MLSYKGEKKKKLNFSKGFLNLMWALFRHECWFVFCFIFLLVARTGLLIACQFWQELPQNPSRKHHSYLESAQGSHSVWIAPFLSLLSAPELLRREIVLNASVCGLIRFKTETKWVEWIRVTVLYFVGFLNDCACQYWMQFRGHHSRLQPLEKVVINYSENCGLLDMAARISQQF
jgi:hypothetical protein